MARALRSKFSQSYDRLLQGEAPESISSVQPFRALGKRLTPPPQGTSQSSQALLDRKRKIFWDELLGLDVEAAFLESRLTALSKEDCIDLKGNINALFLCLLSYLNSADESTEEISNARRLNALSTMNIVLRSILSKNLAGWEVMEVLAGGIAHSDDVFTRFVTVISRLMDTESTPVEFRHGALRLALIFMCGVNQLSPGAYFLRQDFYPILRKIIKASESTLAIVTDASVLLSLLANYHRRDAANLNPYLRCITEEKDEELMRSIIRMVHSRSEQAIKSYRDVHDDTPPTLVSSISGLFSALRPDVSVLPLLGTEKQESGAELFKSYPPPEALVLLPYSEFHHLNKSFRFISTRATLLTSALLDGNSPWVKTSTPVSSPQSINLAPTLLTLISYVLTHATSSSSTTSSLAGRTVAYALLSLNVLKSHVEDQVVMKTICIEKAEIRLCRQRSPTMPLVTKDRPLLASLLDCCVLWLQHNLHKNLQAICYITCVYVVDTVIRYLHRERVRLDYHWEELWRALLGTLDYITNKADMLQNISRLRELYQVTVCTLAFVVHADFLPDARSVHQLIYELVRSAPTFDKQLISSSVPPSPSRGAKNHVRKHDLGYFASNGLASLKQLTSYYSEKISPSEGKAATRSISVVMRTIAREIENDGVDVALGSRTAMVADDEWFDAMRTILDDTTDSTLIRWACQDGMRLK